MSIISIQKIFSVSELDARWQCLPTDLVVKIFGFMQVSSLPNCRETRLADERYRKPFIIRVSFKTLFNNKLHSIGDEPAEQDPNGAKYWVKDGVIHRFRGPAIVSPEKIINSFHAPKEESWVQRGILHRLDGPAFIKYYNIVKGKRLMEWWQNGKRHRTDGPAVIDELCDISTWWIDGNLMPMPIQTRKIPTTMLNI
jgi:hypothetical protein